MRMDLTASNEEMSEHGAESALSRHGIQNSTASEYDYYVSRSGSDGDKIRRMYKGIWLPRCGSDLTHGRVTTLA